MQPEIKIPRFQSTGNSNQVLMVIHKWVGTDLWFHTSNHGPDFLLKLEFGGRIGEMPA